MIPPPFSGVVRVVPAFQLAPRQTGLGPVRRVSAPGTQPIARRPAPPVEWISQASFALNHSAVQSVGAVSSCSVGSSKLYFES